MYAATDAGAGAGVTMDGWSRRQRARNSIR